MTSVIGLLLLNGCGADPVSENRSRVENRPEAANQIAAAPAGAPVDAADSQATEADLPPEVDRVSGIEPGVYGNVRSNEESGDLGGFELEIFPGSQQKLEAVMCEGWCNSSITTRYRVTAKGIAFLYLEELVNSDGSSVQPMTYVFQIEPDGKDLLLSGAILGKEKARLKRLKERDGLAVAAAAVAEAAAKK